MSIPISRMGRVLSYESEKAVAYQRRTELEDIKIIGENMIDEDIAEI